MENTHGLRLRRAEKEDCRFLYELRNEEEVRKNSFQTGIFSYEDHVAWFERKLEEKNTRIYILEQDESASDRHAWIWKGRMEKFPMHFV